MIDCILVFLCIMKTLHTHYFAHVRPFVSKALNSQIARFASCVKMDGGGAYGGGKAGAPFNPIVFIQRPQVILRALCLVSKI